MSDIPGFDPVPIEDYELLLLSTKEQYDKYWTRTSKLIDQGIDRTLQGELTAQDIYQMATQNRAFIFIYKCDKGIQPDVKLVLVMQPCDYPKLPAFFVLLIAGENMKEFLDRFWEKICGWAYVVGARYIDAAVSPAMERILKLRKFEAVTTIVRTDLSEA